LRVEFFGLPGVGKTTLRRVVLNDLKRVSVDKYLPSEEALLRISRKKIDKVFRLPLNILPHSYALKLSRKLRNRSRMQFDAQSKFLAEKGKALESFLSSSTYEGMSTEDRRVVIKSFLSVGALWECVHGNLPESCIVIFAAGFIQNSFMFVDHANDSQRDRDRLYAYLENVPLPDLVVFLTTDLSVCHKRMLGRASGLTTRLNRCDEEGVVRFLKAAQAHMQLVVEWLSKNHSDRLLEVRSDQGMAEAGRIITERIQQLTAH